MENVKVAQLTEENLQKIQELEKQLAICLVAYEVEKNEN